MLTNQRMMRFILWLLTLLPTILWFPPKTTCLEDVPEFQYPCYTDVCTFPGQYCNYGERRCSPCTRYVCRQDPLPLACKYTCLKYDLVPSSTQKAAVTSAPTKDGEGTYVHWLMIYSAVALTVLISILIVILIVYCKRIRNRMSFKPPNNMDDGERTNRTMNFVEDQQRLRLVGPRNREATGIEEWSNGGPRSEVQTSTSTPHAAISSLPMRRLHSTSNGYPVSGPHDVISNASNEQTLLKKRFNASISQTMETSVHSSQSAHPVTQTSMSYKGISARDSSTHACDTEHDICVTQSLLGNRQTFTDEDEDTSSDIVEAGSLVKVHKDASCDEN